VPLVHGQEIGAGEIEREVSGWDAVRFARLCNAVAWASTWPRAQALPAFTERVIVADNGIDAQWQGDLSPDAIGSSPLLTAGINVYQYKKREVTEQTRRNLVTSMASSLRGAIADVQRRSETTLGNYVLFTNIDLTTEQHGVLRAAIAEDCDDQTVRIGIIGAADLAAMLNAIPHVRSAFFATSAFRTWGESWDAHERTTVFPRVALTGRDGEVATLRGWIDDPEVRVIALSGTHMMGKTRVTLEATRQRDVSFIEALDRQALTIDQLRRLEVADREVLVLINDPDFELAQDLARETVGRDRLKLLLCLPTAEATPAPSFGLDTRVRSLHLQPLTYEQSRALLGAARSGFDYGLETWIIENAGGVPGVILAAAHVGPALRRGAGNFLDQIADGFERDLRARLSEDDRRALSALSVMSHVGVERQAVQDLEQISAHFGIDPNTVLNSLASLVGAGFVRIDGSYAEVVPPPLANRLASRVIRGRSAAVAALFRNLNESARRRFLRRLVMLTGDEARRFWDDLLSPAGPFTSLEQIAANSKLFEFVASANGPRAAPLLLRFLRESSVEERRSITGRTRRDLVHAIEELLFREETGQDALYCLGLLAEAENEQWTNNASGIFKEPFFPLHSQIPLRLPARLEVLRHFLQPDQSESLARLAVEAAAGAMDIHFSATLRSSATSVPLGTMPTMTRGQVWNYQGDCLDLMVAASRDTRASVRCAAGELLPRALANFIALGQHQRAMPHLREIVDRALAGDDAFAFSQLAESIRWCRYALRDEAHGGAEANAAVIDELTQLLSRPQTAGFATRLRLWVGGWTLDLDHLENPTGSANRAITALAEEACRRPDLLTDDLVDWLASGAAQASRFWYEVGRLDTAGAFQSRIRALGSRNGGVQAFTSYISGWFERDPDAARTFFEDAAGDDLTTARAILFGAVAIDPPDAGAQRIAQLLRANRIEPRTVDAMFVGPWVGQVSEASLVTVLELLAGPDFEQGPQIPQLIGFRLHDRHLQAGPLADFAWRYLEANPVMSLHLGAYYCDMIAAQLAHLDRDRAFALLDRVIREERDGQRWNPLISRPQMTFWHELTTIDRARGLAILLEAARGDSPTRWSVQFHLPNLIDLEADAPLLLDYARRGEDEAIDVCHAITGGDLRFWPLAFQLVELYPQSRHLTAELEARVEQLGQMIRGPYSEHFRRCLDDVAQTRQQPGASANVRAWLDDFASRLERAWQEQRRREADERVNRG